MFQGIFQPMHLLVILVAVLIVFGPTTRFKGPPKGRPPSHPLPVTGAAETSHGVKTEPPSDTPDRA